MSLAWLAVALALGAPSPHLRFSHARHVESESETTCQACHPGASERLRPMPSVAPGHPRCAACHPEVTAGGAGCALCHVDEPRAVLRPAQPLRFSHALHTAQGANCVACHDPKALSPAATFERCAACHKATRCETCHLTRADGRLQTDLPGGPLVPRGGHTGTDHRPGFNHGRAARSENCQVCHEARACDSCHRGVTRPLALHPADWQLTHATVARGDAEQCKSCHRSGRECASCHRATQMTQGTTPRPNRQVHPAGFADDHRGEARRNLRSCTSCHAERDCIRCHGAPGRGLGARVHPPGFGTRACLMHTRNSRPCLRCHLPADLERRCP